MLGGSLRVENKPVYFNDFIPCIFAIPSFALLLIKNLFVDNTISIIYKSKISNTIIMMNIPIGQL